MIKKLLVTLLLSSHIYAAKNITELIRPYLTDLIGRDFTESLIGKPLQKTLERAELPPIPKISKDTKSVDVFTEKFIEKNRINKEDKQGYDYNFVKELILSTRNLDADDVEVRRWMNPLEQGGSREGVYRAMVLDSYYANLENYNQPLSTTASNYAQKFFERFIGKIIKPSQFQGMNIYTVKRIATENCLDILDVYLQKNQYKNFLSWYSIFSGEIATDFPIWESKMRASSSVEKHKNWASSVPTEFVKSEVILKVHKLFNNLQRSN